jgi:nitroimidazol reductase NimA-like FMN-containing flavoprotein (pyridoxamine 5'-phosphate oxidase superfamily)
MIRHDREIREFDEIINLLRRCDTIRLGIHDEPFPYVVPLSFGFEVKDGKIVLYFHGAKRGLKHELLAKDNRVCVEASICHGFVPTRDGGTTVYESIIGFGMAEIVNGEAAERGLDLLLGHCKLYDTEIDPEGLKHTRVYRITLDSLTGKRSNG